MVDVLFDKLGQPSDSPTDISTDAASIVADAGQKSASPPDKDEAGNVIEPEVEPKPEVKAEPEVKVEPEVEPKPDDKLPKLDDKPLPYDKDPKWLAARDAQKTLTEILEKHGYDDAEELNEALESGASLKEILGSNDATTVVQKAKTLDDYETHWKQTEALKLEEGETPEETVARIKQDNADLRKDIKNRDDRARLLKDSEDTTSGFEKVVTKTLEGAENMSDAEKGLAKLVLGVDNPILDVDVKDRGAVKEAIKGNVTKLGDLIKTIQQAAIDKYASGKSEIIPIKPDDGGAPKVNVVESKSNLPANASVEEVFQDANNELIEILNKEFEGT